MGYKIKVDTVAISEEDKRIKFSVILEDDENEQVIGDAVISLPLDASDDDVKKEIENKSKEVIAKYEEATELKNKLNNMKYNI